MSVGEGWSSSYVAEKFEIPAAYATSEIVLDVNGIRRLVECTMLESNDKMCEVVSEAVHSLIRIREFLGLQLDHAWGNISETEYESRAEEYFAEQESGDPRNLQEKIRLLASVMNAPLDGEMVSAIFKCSIVDTHRAMEALEEERKMLPRNG